MRTIKIGGSYSGKISTGSYENANPGFYVDETIDDCQMTDAQVAERLAFWNKMCFDKFKEAEQDAIRERIERERRDLRIIKGEDGRLYPSVTSIINFDADFFVSQEELIQYAAQGNIIDARVKEFIKTGNWVEPKALQDVWTDIVICAKGSLALSTDVGDFPAFLKKYPITQMKCGERLRNEEYLYCGENDFIGIPDFKDAEKVMTVFDVKRTADKVKNGLQLAAYAKMLGVKQGIICQINDKTEQGFSKPIVYDEKTLDGYFLMFTRKRNAFKARYGI